MKYEGKITKLDQIIVSDPSYDKDIWCRYENNKANMNNCRVQINIAKYHDIISADEIARTMPEELKSQVTSDLELEGVEFQVLISDSRFNFQLDDGGFSHPMWVNLKEYTIGMDTACVSLGVNEKANEIRREKDAWQPASALTTLTDGEFGVVYEGKTPKEKYNVCIYISGNFDADTGHTEELIKNYLEEQLQIEDLHPVETAQQTENELEIGEML